MRESVREAEAKANVALEAPSPLAERLAGEAVRDLLLIVASLRGIEDADPESRLREAAAWVLSELKSSVLRDGLRDCLDLDTKERPRVSTLVAVASHLAALIDTRTPREIVLKHVTLLVALVLLVTCGVRSVFGPKNLALGRAVTASSVCAYTPPAGYRLERLGRVVDGARLEKTFAMCTDKQAKPWIEVDLAGMHTISDVIVYARTDCCWGQDDLPLSVEISKDDKRFTTIGTRRSPFTDDMPWRVDAGDRRARYVRLIIKAPEARNIVISEIEVHGH